MKEKPFWERHSLSEMSAGQWESLCDGCGRCCALKLEDIETSAVHYTRAACRLLDTESCRCTDYANRAARVPDCVVLNAERAHMYDWLPPTCAYRRLASGKTLFWWHPLVSGDPESVHRAGVSARGRLISETHVHAADLPTMLMRWEDDESDAR